MSKRALDAASKIYPSETTFVEINSLRFVKTDRRAAFIKGYELAEKDTIDYACYELELRLSEYLNYNGIQVERSEFIKDFRKAMEDK